MSPFTPRLTFHLSGPLADPKHKTLTKFRLTICHITSPSELDTTTGRIKVPRARIERHDFSWDTASYFSGVVHRISGWGERRETRVQTDGGWGSDELYEFNSHNAVFRTVVATSLAGEKDRIQIETTFFAKSDCSMNPDGIDIALNGLVRLKARALDYGTKWVREPKEAIVPLSKRVFEVGNAPLADVIAPEVRVSDFSIENELPGQHVQGKDGFVSIDSDLAWMDGLLTKKERNLEEKKKIARDALTEEKIGQEREVLLAKKVRVRVPKEFSPAAGFM